MTQHEADVFISHIKNILQSLDFIMSFDPLTHNITIKTAIGTLAAEISTWIDYDFLKKVRTEYPEIDFSALDIPEGDC